MTDIPWIVSLDDHVVEPPDLWTSRLPARYRDVGPHIVMAPTGAPILDGGGYIDRYQTYYADMAFRGDRPVIDGYCASACTIALTVPGVCVTPRAVLGFHAAYYYQFLFFGRTYLHERGTAILYHSYPPGIQRWIDRHGGLKRQMIYLRGKALRTLVPSCRKEQ